MYLTDRAWTDVISYNPDLPPVVSRVPRDEDYIAALVAVLDDFVVDLEDAKERLSEHKIMRPWDLERAIDQDTVTLQGLVERAEGVDVEILSFDDRLRIDDAIQKRNLDEIQH